MFLVPSVEFVKMRMTSWLYIAAKELQQRAEQTRNIWKCQNKKVLQTRVSATNLLDICAQYFLPREGFNLNENDIKIVLISRLSFAFFRRRLKLKLFLRMELRDRAGCQSTPEEVWPSAESCSPTPPTPSTTSPPSPTCGWSGCSTRTRWRG